MHNLVYRIEGPDAMAKESRNEDLDAAPKAAAELVCVLHKTLVAIVRHAEPDLTARQLAVFLICYLTDREHRVIDLAAKLKVASPTITRALDRLQGLDWIRRGADENDRRSVVVRKTPAGSAYLRSLKSAMLKAASSGG